MTSHNICDFAGFIARYLPGKIQKISINAALPCPNRDGSKGIGGCIYCNNESFSPGLLKNRGAGIAAQIEAGKRFFARKYPNMKYLAYFQSYTATNGPVDYLMELFSEALSQPDVIGIVIGTRPDCMSPQLLDRLIELRRNSFVMIEYGAETSHDRTLLSINRCHTWADTASAVTRTANAGIPVGLHLIMGLPGESRSDMLATIDAVNLLPVDIIKCHQLQVIRSTKLHLLYQARQIDLNIPSVDEYVDLCCDIIMRLRPEIAVERFISQSPPELLIAPRWGLKNYQFVHLVKQRLQLRLDKLASVTP